MVKDLLKDIPTYISASILSVIKRYYSTYKRCHFDELFLNSYTFILENISNFENFEDLDEGQKVKLCFRWSANAINHYLKSVKNTCSLDAPKFKNNSKVDCSYLCPVKDKHSIDLPLLKQMFVELLNEYTLKSKNILVDYILKDCSKEIIFNKYQVKDFELGVLVSNFRHKYSDLLVLCGYWESKHFLENLDFHKFSRDGTFTKSREKRQIRLVCGDIKIIELVKTLNADDVCKTLNISLGTYKDIIEHRKGSSKFWLYQVQILRKKYFNEYSFEELLKVE